MGSSAKTSSCSSFLLYHSLLITVEEEATDQQSTTQHPHQTLDGIISNHPLLKTLEYKAQLNTRTVITLKYITLRLPRIGGFNADVEGKCPEFELQGYIQ